MKKDVSLFLIFFSSLLSYAQLPVYTATVYDSASLNGYYFILPLPDGKQPKDLMILDKYGNLVCYKPVASSSSNFSLRSNGIMAYANSPDYFLMDSEFRITDTLKCKNVFQADAHDQLILPNGHFLLLGMERFIPDLKKYNIHWKKQFGPDSLGVLAVVIQEQDARRDVVWEWHAKDHFDFADVDTFLFKGDWTHSNALALDTDGNILLSSRNFDEITKINRHDGSIMWRWGGRRNEFKFANCPVPFYGQHDIRRIKNGHFTLFDNGENTVSHGARGMEFELDETNKVATLKWSYTFDPDMSSDGQGNVQRLDNSNTLVNFGRISCDSVCFVIVDSSGKKVFQLDGVNTYRALNYPSLPWQLHRPSIMCFDSAGITYLDAGGGSTSYRWSNGDSTRIIRVTKGSTYSVFEPYGEGAYMASEKFVVGNLIHPCSAERHEPHGGEKLKIVNTDK